MAQELIDAGKPVDLMIGGHQHQALFDPVLVGDTVIVSAGYYGRYLGQVDVSINQKPSNSQWIHTSYIPSLTPR